MTQWKYRECIVCDDDQPEYVIGRPANEEDNHYHNQHAKSVNEFLVLRNTFCLTYYIVLIRNYFMLNLGVC